MDKNMDKNVIFGLLIVGIVAIVAIFAISSNGISKNNSMDLIGEASRMRISAVQQTCYDSDGGIVPDVFGAVTFKDRKYPDKCISENELLEMYCDRSGNLASVNIHCGRGQKCVNGACEFIQAPPIQGSCNGFGDGTSANPFEIYTCTDLQNIQNSSEYLYYQLCNNIDCSDTINWNNGLGFTPLGFGLSFRGDFNGNNFKISNLYIDALGQPHAGLFSKIQGTLSSKSRVYDLELDNVEISGGVELFSELTSVGALVGDCRHCEIINVKSSGLLKGTRNVGGLIGEMWYSSVHDSSSSAVVKPSLDYVTNANFGGLIGLGFYDSVIENSFASGNVYNAQRIGGLIGHIHDDSIILNSYALGDVLGTSYGIGGLVGTSANTEIINSYALGTVSDDNSVISVRLGGLVGVPSNTNIINSYFAGNLIKNAPYGGIGGVSASISGNTDFTNVYFDSNKAGTTQGCSNVVCPGTNSRTTQQMKQQSTFQGWDFVNIWGLSPSINHGYPHLKN